ncbi:MAG TPA: FtsQ-type POTRA domain-containing protein [Methylomirabilota bacterium]|jgi:cell division protein FtsQ|nr:FtsQ-type POTRA domain-containing protein [Methylomirabilota bacterium]
MERQRVSRARLARRVTRRVRWVTSRAVPIGIALATLGAAGLGALWALTSPRFTVTEVAVTGASRLRPEDVVAASGIGPGTNLFRLDRAAVVARLEALPLIRHADMVRRFPNQVTLAVEERRPFTLAHAGRLHWIDEQGVNLGAETRAVAPKAPVITGLGPADLAWGDGSPSPRVAAGISLLRVLLRSETTLLQQISEIDVSRPDGPVLYTVDGIEVRLGADDWEGRLGRLQGVLAQVRSGGEAVGAIDLRFRDQVVLKTVTR